ncbi:MAG TPA: hypothetical protein VL651_17135 [Bacteroidia bacterium]|jgi:hypothetical protein|nr:hypothetical protein [Bacteroidia bacterium]
MKSYWAIFLFLFLTAYGCGSEDPAAKDPNDSGVPANDTTRRIESEVAQNGFPLLAIEDTLENFMKGKGYYGSDGDFILTIKDTFHLGIHFFATFTDSNDDFGIQENGIALLDDDHHILDTYLFSIDSVDVNTICSEAFTVKEDRGKLSLLYSVLFSDEPGKKYLDSIESKYWESTSGGIRPDQDHYGFRDIPAKYVDTVLFKRQFIIENNKLVLFSRE